MSRTARALTESPISANSAPACTSVLMMPVRWDGAGGGGGAVDGRLGRCAVADGRALLVEVVGGRLVGAAVAVERFASFAAVVVAGRFASVAVRVDRCLEASPSVADARLLLRRCGRVRGSAPRISDGSSLGGVMGS